MSYNFMVSRATIYDHSEILKLLMTWWDEVKIENYPPVTDEVANWIMDLMTNHIVLVVRINEKIVGCMGLRNWHFPWNKEKIGLINEFLIVEPDYRKQGIMDKLIEVTKSLVKEADSFLFLGHFSGTKAKEKDRYFRMKGFTYTGGNLLYIGEK